MIPWMNFCLLTRSRKRHTIWTLGKQRRLRYIRGGKHVGGGGVINLFVICVNFLCRYPRLRKSLSFQYEMISWIGLYKQRKSYFWHVPNSFDQVLYGLQWWTSPWDTDEMWRTIFFKNALLFPILTRYIVKNQEKLKVPVFNILRGVVERLEK